MLAIVRWLVEEAGADTTRCGAKGFTAAEVVRFHENFEIDRYLLRDEKEAKAVAATSALLAELQEEEEAERERGNKKKSKKARKKGKKRDKEMENEKERQREEDQQKKRERQEQDDRLRPRQAREQQERVRKEEEERVRRAIAEARLKDLGHNAGFYCFLYGGLLMRDPCIALDGYSYERQALAAHIAMAKASGTPLLSPTTGQAMGEFYVTNHLLRNQLQAWVEERQP